jgi:hypothetical protein
MNVSGVLQTEQLNLFNEKLLRRDSVWIHLYSVVATFPGLE